MTRFLSIAALATATILASACTTAAVDDGQGDPQRGPLGKADAVGTCAQTDCDGPAPVGNCWCDAQCVEFGDCCTDHADTCEATEVPAGHDCGGLAGLTCGTGEYCHYGQAQSCGAGDQTGTCEPLPAACFQAVIPVCGCNGQTYTNACFAAQAGVTVQHDGGC